MKPFLSTVIVSGTLHVYISQTDRGELVFGASVDPFTSYSMRGSLEFVEGLAATGTSIAGTGTTTWRPPYAPVSLGALAGQAFEPVRYSPMQPWHEAHGAVPLVAGAWIRPDHYGDPAAGARNVRERSAS